MDLSSIKPPVFLNSVSSISSVVPPVDEASRKPVATGKSDLAMDQQQSPKDQKELNSDEINKITDGLNKFMKTIDTDLKFEIHEKTNRVIVQVVDSKDQRVIKEFPPHELLDTLAAIRDYVGLLLDKKA